MSFRNPLKQVGCDKTTANWLGEGAHLEADSSYLVRYKYLSHLCTQTPVPISMSKVKAWEASSHWFLLLISSIWPPQHSETGVTSVENKKLYEALCCPDSKAFTFCPKEQWTSMFGCTNGQNNASQHTKLPDGVQAVFSVNVWSHNFFLKIPTRLQNITLHRVLGGCWSRKRLICFLLVFNPVWCLLRKKKSLVEELV